MKRVFLGGTCNGSKWRDTLVPMLKINYFNPVVEDWNKECMERELFERKNCDFCLYVITPRKKGDYSIAEVIDDSNKCPAKTVFCVLGVDEGISGFDKFQLKSLEAVANMVARNGATVCSDLFAIAQYLNSQNDEPVPDHVYKETSLDRTDS